MRVIDLTHTIMQDMPVYPGTETPTLEESSSYAKNGFRETRFTIISHTGTHIDAPAHIFEHGQTLDKFEADTFIGKALVIDCRAVLPGGVVTTEHLKAYENLDKLDFLLFNFGWDKKWGTDEYFDKYPCLGDDVIDFVLQGNYKGIGVDVISIDSIFDSSLKKHKRLLANKNIIIAENLKNLDLCSGEVFTFVCLPIKSKNADGAPARAIGILGVEI